MTKKFFSSVFYVSPKFHMHRKKLNHLMQKRGIISLDDQWLKSSQAQES